MHPKDRFEESRIADSTLQELLQQWKDSTGILYMAFKVFALFTESANIGAIYILIS